jgi:hypothetical protein
MQQICKQIIKDIIDPQFIENGFKKKRNNFGKIFPDFAWVVNIQFSKWNTKEHLEFTFNIGISIDKLYGPYYWREKPKFPIEVESVLRYRISELINIRNDPWYVLNENTSVEELKSEIKRDIKVIFSHFERFQTIEDIIAEIEKPKSLGRLESPHLLTILYHEYGNIEEAEKRFRRMYSECPDEYQKEFMTSMGERLGIQI